MAKILIIEDDAFLQGLEVAKLQKYGHTLLTASNGEEGMEKITEPGVEVILLDLILPNFDGFEILKKIKETESIKDIPVLVFSNLSDEAEIKKAEALGAKDFMVKSNFTLDELAEKIKSIVK